MKTTILLVGFALLAISASTNNVIKTKEPAAVVNKKVQPAFAYFRVHRMANDAMLNWGHVNPIAAVYFKIERSYDGTWFEPVVDEMQATASSTYKYRDNTVFPGTIYYRVTAFHHDGSREQSPIESLRIVKRN